MATYSILVFNKTLVISGQCNHEEQALDALETMDPFLALGTLPTNIHHAEVHLAQFK
jgi:hypothetical protein